MTHRVFLKTSFRVFFLLTTEAYGSVFGMPLLVLLLLCRTDMFSSCSGKLAQGILGGEAVPDPTEVEQRAFHHGWRVASSPGPTF